MEINSLLESANGYKALAEDAKRLADKWSASGLLEGLKGKEADTMSIMLENQAKQIVAEQSSTGTGAIGATGAGNEQWAGVALPLVRKVFAQISSKDFVSVQPMNLPSGLVFYLDFKYGTTGHGKSGNMYGNVTEAGNKMGVDVDAAGGLYGAGAYGYSIATASLALSTQSTGSVAMDKEDVNFDDSVTLANYAKVNVALSGLNAAYDAEGIRAFRLISESVDITGYPEWTKVYGSIFEFVVLKS